MKKIALRGVRGNTVHTSFEAVCRIIGKFNFPFVRLVSLTDGTKSMTDETKGFVSRLTR